jgi:hypothetical protein
VRKGLGDDYLGSSRVVLITLESPLISIARLRGRRRQAGKREKPRKLGERRARLIVRGQGTAVAEVSKSGFHVGADVEA